MAKKTIKVTLPDRTKIELDKGLTLQDLAAKLPPKIRKAALAGKINDKLVDLNTKIPDKAKVEIVTFASEEGKEILRHSASHIMAQAVLELYSKAKLGIGPAIADGFYYDFDLPKALAPDDLQEITKRMQKISANNLSFVRQEMPAKEAIKLFKSLNQPYKVELLKDISDKKVTVYRQGEFVDLCRGPLVPSTNKIQVFKLLSVAGAYWKGDEKQPMLQRIYGTAFINKKALEEHLYKLEEAEKRDHRKLGRELDLFSLNDEFGLGLPLWHPKGSLVRKIIEDFWKDEHLKASYEIVMTPHIAKVDLWKKSGHWDFYRENMYSPMEIEDQAYVIKPMNCPAHILIYQSRTRSYRDLPMRFAELGTVYRFERSGVLHGLLRVRGFTQDDAHIFCSLDQLEEEIIGVLNFCLFMLRTFGFDQYEVYLSTRPEKYVGSLTNWKKATEALEKALKKAKLVYEIDPGEGVFYGPKIDIKIKDALGRAWQCTTIQVDFNFPDRFKVTYVGKDNKEHQPIMIHRALLGSFERFMGCLIEHYAGAFPLWIAPVQAVVLPIADRHTKRAQEVTCVLREKGIRVELDKRTESVNKKIRDAQLQKVPYMLVIGDNEIKTKTLAVRDLSGRDKRGVKLASLIKKLVKEVRDKK